MFSQRPAQSTKVQTNNAPGPGDRAHMILVKSLWFHLVKGIPSDSDSAFGLDVKLRFSLSNKDYLLLKRFVENSPNPSTPSADSINDIISNSIELITPDEPYEFKLSYENLYFVLPFIIYLAYRKFGKFAFTVLVVLSVASYELYVSAIAKRHALISKLPSIPEHCLPNTRQSFLTWLLSHTPFGASDDVCVEYFKLQMTSPYSELRPDRILYHVVKEFFENIFETAGACVGQFYSKLNSFIPFYVAIPLTCLCLYLLFRYAYSLRRTRRKRAVSKRNTHIAIKNK